MLDLKGRTVTQVLTIIGEATEQNTGEELEILIDNEIVKLNLYNYLHRVGLQFKMERQGPNYLFKINGSRKQRRMAEEKAAASGSKGGLQTAFPVGHLSGEQTDQKPKRGIRKRRGAAGAQANPGALSEAPFVPPTEPRTQPILSQAQQDMLLDPDPTETDQTEQTAQTAQTAETQSPTLGWIIVQSDQIGQKDATLGFELLEDLLSSMDQTRCLGFFFIHRGVRLLDPSYNRGRIFQMLRRKSLPVMACTKSVAFYQLTQKIAADVQVIPAREILNLAEQHKLTWV